MQQIKTIAQQMYPTDWRRFLAYFETETSRPYGKVIIDLHPETKEKDRFVVDDDFESLQINVDNSSTVLQIMKARQQMQHPYMNAVQNKQEEMKRLLETPLLMTESEKVIKYNEMMNDFLAYKKHLQPPVAIQPPVNIPNNPNILQEVQPTPQQVRKRPSASFKKAIERR